MAKLHNKSCGIVKVKIIVEIDTEVNYKHILYMMEFISATKPTFQGLVVINSYLNFLQKNLKLYSTFSNN